MPTTRSNLLPALRAQIGDRRYYITTMTFADVSQWIRPVDEIHERKELKSWIQRELTPVRQEEIASYLLNQPEHFFNSIVAGIYAGNPEWFPVAVGDNPSEPDLEPGDRESNAFGLLKLSGNEEIFAIDGQHRVEGIRTAIARKPSLATEEICVIFVGHATDDAGHKRTRRLFFTLNRYAKPVSQADLIALSEDDAFAIATRRMIDEYPGLDEKKVAKASGANIPTGDTASITTLVALYRSVVTITQPTKSADRRRLKQGPLQPGDGQKVFEQAAEFWDCLKRRVPQIRRVCSASEPAQVTPAYRTQDGGHLLFRPLGLRCFSEACRVLLDRGRSMPRAVLFLTRVTLQLSEQPWLHVLWNPHTKRMAETKNALLAKNIFLHSVSEAPDPPHFDTLGNYRMVTAQPTANLPRPVR
jgi:DNA sulfur modification protein DndB